MADQPTLGFHVFTALRPLGGARLLRTSGGTGLDTLAARLPDGRVMASWPTRRPRGRHAAATPLRGDNRRSLGAHLLAAAPLGATTRLSVVQGGVRVAVPALGVAVLTLTPAR